MAKQVKCPICNKMNDKANTEQIGQRYYCKRCADKKREQTKRNTDGWDTLFEYICKLYNIQTLTVMMFKQIKDFRKEPYNFTNIGMYLTLKYYYETLNHEVKEDVGLGIIPYYYDRAEKQYMDIVRLEDYMNEFELTEQESVVTIDKNKMHKEIIKRKKLQYKNINWEEE
ncbi:hypothetical protein G8S49_05575 [Clostridium botulinum C]|uniref:Uncharacterized protein n=2 Tax=Clostridium botulinum TaxID=1491 RepID=A0A6G4D9D3_CLOBO|nr:hypothetical protein [Clostridium botulinum]MCD3194898.1 hypothetical protein [Clostridium botulinum C]MCD3200167.1 hypothetical protein [Clostridium botulinum C]MCD3205766.1 hypothetical protein [Clostridium botulinum C]MCD3207399.1 hypothetical protein [Clostridium botulinum C]MCD3226133.1 hypothetical protein [Clostridium botulinum C]